jgi:periplasmic protein TonB
MFETLDQTNRFDVANRLLTFLVSIIVHAIAILIFIMLPLVFLNVLQEGEFLTFLFAPPEPPTPPPPPLPPHGPGEKPQPIQISGIDYIPPFIPHTIPPPDDEPLIANLARIGNENLIRGELIGTPSDGLKNTLRAGMLPPPPPPLEVPTRSHEPVPVVSNLQEAKLISKVQPIYPPLALRARVSGVVVLQVSVDEEGNVYDIKILKGHPLLDEAAVSAVRQWKYSPTILNGEPVPVVAAVTVVFNFH